MTRVQRLLERYRSARATDERGAAAIFLIMMAGVLLIAGGLAIDGGLAINARMRVADDAEQAARVAADSVDVAQLRADGTLVIDPALAQQRASQFLAARGYTGAGQYDLVVQPDRVVVRVSDTTDTALLGLINIHDFDVTANASAEPQTGPE